MNTTDLIPKPLQTDPLFVCHLNDSNTGLEGWVSIHATGTRGACGGVRIYPDVTAQEVMDLSRAMTYKYSFLEYQFGGAKAGIKTPPDIQPKVFSKLLSSFGEHIRPLIQADLYHPWTDMNSTAEDIEQIYLAAGKKVSVRQPDSAQYTALSTFASLVATSQHLGLSPQDTRITIEGFGHVGQFLAQEVTAWGGAIIGVSNRLGAVCNEQGLNVQTICQQAQNQSEEWITQTGPWQKMSCQELFTLDMTIHVPCARVYSLNDDVARQLSCKAVVPAANLPCTPEGEIRLNDRQILLLPDFVVNLGGIVGSGLAARHADLASIRGCFSGPYQDMIHRMLQQSQHQKRKPLDLATSEAAKGHVAVQKTNTPLPKRKKLTDKFLRRFHKTQPEPWQTLLAHLTTVFESRF